LKYFQAGSLRYYRVLIFFILALWGYLLVSFSPKNDSIKDVINISFVNTINNHIDFNIHSFLSIPNYMLLKDLFSGLVEIDKNNKVRPAIAKSWTVSKDGKSYIFYLKRTKWSNGVSLIADDFVYAHNKFLGLQKSKYWLSFDYDNNILSFEALSDYK